ADQSAARGRGPDEQADEDEEGGGADRRRSRQQLDQAAGGEREPADARQRGPGGGRQAPAVAGEHRRGDGDALRGDVEDEPRRGLVPELFRADAATRTSSLSTIRSWIRAARALRQASKRRAAASPDSLSASLSVRSNCL